MFGGIVEAVGEITYLINERDCLTIGVMQTNNFNDLIIGDSVAVNGVCLTLTKIASKELYFTAVPETLRLTNLANLALQDRVNLERSLPVNGRVNGHYIQGHVDFCGEITSIVPDGKNALIAKINFPKPYGKYIINKGYIGLDGMSITVIQVYENEFSVTFIPHTKANSIVSDYNKGKKINVEVDMIAKYLEKLTGNYSL